MICLEDIDQFANAIYDFIKNPTFDNYVKLVALKPGPGFNCSIIATFHGDAASYDQVPWTAPRYLSCKNCLFCVERGNGMACIGQEDGLLSRKESEFNKYHSEIILALVRYYAILESQFPDRGFKTI